GVEPENVTVVLDASEHILHDEHSCRAAERDFRWICHGILLSLSTTHACSSEGFNQVRSFQRSPCCHTRPSCSSFSKCAYSERRATVCSRASTSAYTTATNSSSVAGLWMLNASTTFCSR